MGLKVIPEACRFTEDNGQGVVVVECDRASKFNIAIEELQGVASRNLAVAHAATRGMGDPRINGNIGHPYAVNSNGVSLEQVRGDDGAPLAPQHPLMQPARYRVDVPVTRRLV